MFLRFFYIVYFNCVIYYYYYSYCYRLQIRKEKYVKLKKLPNNQWFIM